VDVHVRPLLMFTYWANYSTSGMSSDAYHLTNIAIHVLNVCLVFLILLRIFIWTGWTANEARVGALIGAAIFLVHPLQTESVSYIAGRSESLAASFVLASYAVFLYRRAPAISWLESGAVLVLFAMAVATKENAVALAGVFLLTDLFWPGDGWLAQLWRNRRLYGLMVPGVLVALVGGSPRAGPLRNGGLLDPWRHLVSIRLYAGAGDLRIRTPVSSAGRPVGGSRLRGFPFHHRAWRYLFFSGPAHSWSARQSRGGSVFAWRLSGS
jgi:hypothetical protein